MTQSGKIYLIKDDETLHLLEEQQYLNEDILQTLLAKYPDLLAGDQMDEAAPRRWLLVSRGFGVHGEEEGGERWSLDHLFLDQDGIPTLVKVKRSSDTRIRWEVVGHILNYAVNAVVYWPVDTIRAKFEAACQEQGNDPAQTIRELVEDDSLDATVVDAFWEKVKTNLQAKRVRMVFVADYIPQKLRRIMAKESKYLKIGDAAEYLGVSTDTLRLWDRAKKLVARRDPVTRYRLYSEDDLDRVRRQIRPRR